MCAMEDRKAYLVLANGRVFEGVGFGAQGFALGEAVFTTGMNGYLETLTDPSYFGQIAVQTFPLIGNYGVITDDFESSDVHVRAYVVRSFCDEPSNFRSRGKLDEFLAKQGIVAICGVDTRALTKVLRETGVMNAAVFWGQGESASKAAKALSSDEDKARLLHKIASYKIKGAVESVTCSASKIEQSASQVFAQSALYRAVPVKSDGTKLTLEAAHKIGQGKRVVLWDFGAKANIRRELLKRGFDVTVLPATTTAKDILSLSPDGVMLSNGPGDPKDNGEIIAEIKKLVSSGTPIFGICLGHQLLALAMGANTIKLKYGHRGANQPVKQLFTGRVYISSQNHGYAVENESLPLGAVLSFVNTNDGTCEGVVYTKAPAFSVQFHPEACSGPLDTGFLFDEFAHLMENHALFNTFSTKSFTSLLPPASTSKTHLHNKKKLIKK